MGADVSLPAIALRVKSLQPHRRRAGMLFTREGRDLSPADFADGVEGGEQILAILRDPQLSVGLVEEDGAVSPVPEELIEQLAEAITQADDMVAGEPATAAVDASDTAAPQDGEPAAAAVGTSDTAEPQGEGLPPATEASKAPGPDAGANDSAGSAAGAVTPAPVTEAAPKPAPPPAAKKPSGRTRAKPAKAAD